MGKEELSIYVQNFINCTKEELELILNAFEKQHVTKRQFIVQPGFVNKYRAFVVKGAFRTYAISESGQEQTLQFAIENWWVSDFNSYIYQSPATLFVIALEDSVILNIDYDTEKKLREDHPIVDRFFGIMAEKGLAFEHRRILFNQTHSAEQRYEKFLEHFPNFVQRVPQYALASYLGMSTEFLSRIRNKRTSTKS